MFRLQKIWQLVSLLSSMHSCTNQISPHLISRSLISAIVHAVTPSNHELCKNERYLLDWSKDEICKSLWNTATQLKIFKVRFQQGDSGLCKVHCLLMIACSGEVGGVSGIPQLLGSFVLPSPGCPTFIWPPQLAALWAMGISLWEMRTKAEGYTIRTPPIKEGTWRTKEIFKFSIYYSATQVTFTGSQHPPKKTFLLNTKS